MDSGTQVSPSLTISWSFFKFVSIVLATLPPVIQKEVTWAVPIKTFPWKPSGNSRFLSTSHLFSLLGSAINLSLLQTPMLCFLASWLCLVKNIFSSGLLWWLVSKRILLQCRRFRFDPWVRKMPWRRKWQHTPVFLPGKFHGQRSLVG